MMAELARPGFRVPVGTPSWITLVCLLASQLVQHRSDLGQTTRCCEPAAPDICECPGVAEIVVAEKKAESQASERPEVEPVECPAVEPIVGGLEGWSQFALYLVGSCGTVVGTLIGRCLTICRHARQERRAEDAPGIVQRGGAVPRTVAIGEGEGKSPHRGVARPRGLSYDPHEPTAR